MLSTIGLADLRVDGVPSLAELLAREGHIFKQIVEGATLSRLRDNGALKTGYVVRFEPSCLVFRAGKKTIDVGALKEVRVGLLTQTFLSFAEKHHIEENCAFSVIYEEESTQLPKILNLACSSMEKRDMWAHAFRLLIQTLGNMNAEPYSLMRPWIASLKKGEDSLSLKQTTALLDSLFISVENSREQPKDFRFHFSDFIKLVRRMRSHPVVSYMFASYSSKEATELTREQLMEWLQKEQGETSVSEADVDGIIEKYGQGKMDELAFQNYLISKDNDVWDPNKWRHYHDMTHPLSAYFVNSSHNTYLSGGQLNSVSSIEMYIRALKLGCRCLEIDIWDGPNGEPIVYHGFTLTSKILFRDVLRVIRSHGFVASPYPLILSFENHCSKAQQDKMAVYLKEILGPIMMTFEKTDGSMLPSPNALKGRVLIKGSSHVTSHSEILDDIEEMDEEILKGGTLTKEEITFLQEKMQSKGQTGTGDDKLSTELDALIYLRAKKLAKFPNGYDGFEPNHMTSFSENRILKILQGDHVGFQHLRQFNSQYVSRVYPKGTRFDSSNYDPILLWYAGCQMLALNYQASTGYPMLINWAKFRENGMQGYNLRPNYLNTVVRASGSVQFGSLFAKVERFTRPTPICSRLRLQIFGGRHFPSRRSWWVETMLHDGTAREDRHRTASASHSFSPDFNFECVMPVVDSANAFLSFVAASKEEGPFAFFCIPLECVRPGYRAVHMVDSLYDPIAKGMCHLLCHFAFEK